MVVDDDAAVAIENFAARSGDGQLLDAIAFGLLVIDLGVLDLQVPEAGDQKKEDEYAGVLEYGDFASGELDVFAAGLFAGQRWADDRVPDRWRAGSRVGGLRPWLHFTRALWRKLQLAAANFSSPEAGLKRYLQKKVGQDRVLC